MVKGLWEVETLAAVLTPLAEISQLRSSPSDRQTELTWSRSNGWGQDSSTEINLIRDLVGDRGSHGGAACEQSVKTTF